jgi:UTP--glucose-1-phosphate uridylyltransferase
VPPSVGACMPVRGMVEKPALGEAPSNLAIIGRYILTPEVLRNLDSQQRGAGGEIQLTDAIAQEIRNSNNVHGFRFRGQRFDCGSKAGYLKATVAFALSRPDLRDELEAYLHELIATRQAAQ